MTARTVPTVRGVRSSDLHAGDVVWTHGMRVRLDEPRTYPGAYGPVTVAVGTVLNLPDVLADGIVPPQFLYEWTSGTVTRRDRWTVQGNDHATWTVERPCCSHPCPGTDPATVPAPWAPGHFLCPPCAADAGAIHPDLV